MSYIFATIGFFINFLSGSNIREGADGNQSKIYFDDRENKAIKVFSLKEVEEIKKKELKIKELMKLRSHFPTVAIPEEIIECKGKCVGYVMPKINDAISIRDFQIQAKRRKCDLKESIHLACEIARFIEHLHSENIVFGDLHSDQFLTKNGKIYVCDSDTWGFENKNVDYEADRAGKPEYVDPQVRNFDKTNELHINGYTRESDYYSLAVIIFEMLVGFNPFDGKYPIVKKYDRSLRALNHISILGNHDLTNLDSLKIEHLAWMSTSLQNDFMQIFEGNKRYNILKSLERTEKQLKKCKGNHYYNSERYSKCPCCSQSKLDDALYKFRNFKYNPTYYDKKRIFRQNNIRKIMDFSTILDYDNNAIHQNENGTVEKEKISAKVQRIYFTNTGKTIKLTRISKTKQFFSRLFRKLKDKDFYKMKWSKASNDCVCELEIFDNQKNKIYSDIILNLGSKLKISGDYICYAKKDRKLVLLRINGNTYSETILSPITNPFIYEINEYGEYCVCSVNQRKGIQIILNGKEIKSIIDEVPMIIRYDSKRREWYIVTIDSKRKYKVYAIFKGNKVKQRFSNFSINGLSIKNCIFYDSMLIIPADRRILFLKSGSTLEKSIVIERKMDIVNRESILEIHRNQINNILYLYVRNENQIYRIELR